MNKLFLVSLLITIEPLRSQSIYFPDDNATEQKFAYSPVDLIKNATQLEKGSQAYQETIDTIISRGVLKLTLAITRSLSSTIYQKDNLVYAPINIAGALALVLLGSSGKTFDEVSNVLGLATGVSIQSRSQIVHEQLGKIFIKLERSVKSDLTEDVKLATAIFVQNEYTIREVFKDASEKIYKSEVLNLDFQNNPSHAKSVINAWVSDRTNGKITELIADTPPTTTKVIIASALYFKAAWENPFIDGVTNRRKFFANGRNSSHTSMVDMMSNGGNFPYYRDHILDVEIMGFPYKGNKSMMYVLMPTHSNKERLSEIENKLTPSELLRLVDNMIYRKCAIGFPKMKLESTIDLSSTLKDLGVNALFNPYESNLGVMSSGVPTLMSNNNFEANGIRNPLSSLASLNDNDEDVLIFTRMGDDDPANCTQIFDAASNLTKCEIVDNLTQKQVTYKKFGDKVGRRIAREARRSRRGRSRTSRAGTDTLDSIRLNLQPADNPGLYADKVLHKVFMEITETGTEAAASTGISLSRGGDIIIFRVDVPFLYFIMNQESKLVLFWGAVNTPTPHYN